MKILLTKEAEDQLEAVYDFLYGKSPSAATKLYNDLIDGMESLAEQPRLGRIETLLNLSAISYRSLILRRSYRVVYRMDGDTIVVVALFDCRQNPDKLSENTAP